MLADAETVRHEMQELAGLKMGRVRIGATPTLCVSLVPDVLTSFHAAYPGIDLHLTEQGSRGLLDELAGGTLDLALIVTSEDRSAPTASLQRTPLLTEELVVVASANSPHLAGRMSLTLAELAVVPQITYHESYDLREATMQAFHAAGLTPNVVLEGSEMDAVLRCVERGLGVAVVPAMVMLDRPRLCSVRLTDPGLSRTISLAHRNDVSLTRAAQAMQEMVVQTANALSAADAVTRPPSRHRKPAHGRDVGAGPRSRRYRLCFFGDDPPRDVQPADLCLDEAGAAPWLWLGCAGCSPPRRQRGGANIRFTPDRGRGRLGLRQAHSHHAHDAPWALKQLFEDSLALHTGPPGCRPAVPASTVRPDRLGCRSHGPGHPLLRHGVFHERCLVRIHAQRRQFA